MKPSGSSLVEIDLIEQPDGTLLRLTHTGLPNAEQCAGHASRSTSRPSRARIMRARVNGEVEAGMMVSIGIPFSIAGSSLGEPCCLRVVNTACD